MSRYWVIAPHSFDYPETWDKIWQFDLANGIISICWHELGDVSKYDENELRSAIEKTFPQESTGTKAKYLNIVWDFYNIQVGDIVIARKGRKRAAAIGTVTKTGYYSQGKNIEANGPENFYPNHVELRWHNTPRLSGNINSDKKAGEVKVVHCADEEALHT